MSRAAIAVAVVLSALVAAPLVDAERPGSDGRIAFMRKDDSGLWQVWVANADLSHQVQVTRAPSNSGWPVWSPHGDRLAFDSDREDAKHPGKTLIDDIYTMNPDGSGLTKLTDSTGGASDAAWSPDGMLIAFAADRKGHRGRQEIWIMNADGTAKRRITTLPAAATVDSAPRFSPDGRRLVFTRYHGTGETEKAALYTIGVDGTRLHRVTSFAIHAGDADWAPDGTRLVFEAGPTPNSLGQIFVIDADGRHLHNLTHNTHGAGSADPVWAPDGAQILFLDLHRTGGKLVNGLATMHPDGSSHSFLGKGSNNRHKPDAPAVEHQPDWESSPTTRR